MGQVIPKQHPSVVLRSHFNAMRSLLIAALVAVCALAAALVIVATDDEQASIAPKSATVLPQSNPALQADKALPAGTRFDGGPDEGTRGPQASPAAPGTRFDGGPDEGTRGPQASPAAPGTRFDGGPDEGTRGPQSYWESSEPRSSYQPVQADGTKARAGGPTLIIPMGPSH